MRRTLCLACLMLLSASVAAQPRTLRVRLFWQHPPRDIRIVPEATTIRRCAACAPTSLTVPVQITAKGSTVVAQSIPSSTLLLRGRSRVTGDEFSPFTIDDELRIQSRDGFLLLTLTMPLETYVTTVLQGESTVLKSDEVLKAMAVAVRTYAVHFESRHKSEGFDFCDTTHCQDVRLGNESPRVRAAVAATESELLWFEGKPAATYYHRSCGGEIEDAGTLDPGLHAAYLRPHHDDYCLRTPDEWSAEISKADLGRTLNHPINALAVAARSRSGRVRTLLIDNRPISAAGFRLAIGRALGWDKLRSDLYQIEDRGDRISFRGRGQGHGVGLCQTGAEIMAEQERTYQEILAFYYPGTAVGLNARGLTWKKLSGESLDLVSTNPNDAAILFPAAERALRFVAQQTGWGFNTHPLVKVYPTLPIYRDATGEPGWVAASTHGDVVRLQPIAILRRTHALDRTLRHEFLHMLIESRARPDTPLWLREGLAVYLSDPDAIKPARVDVVSLEKRLHSLRGEEDTRLAYRQCAAAVAEAVEKNGLGVVLARLNAQNVTR